MSPKLGLGSLLLWPHMYHTTSDIRFGYQLRLDEAHVPLCVRECGHGLGCVEQGVAALGGGNDLNVLPERCHSLFGVQCVVRFRDKDGRRCCTHWTHFSHGHAFCTCPASPQGPPIRAFFLLLVGSQKMGTSSTRREQHHNSPKISSGLTIDTSKTASFCYEA